MHEKRSGCCLIFLCFYVFSFYAEFFHSILHILAADTEELSGTGNIAAAFFERVDDHLLFNLGERAVQILFFVLNAVKILSILASVGRCPHSKRKMLDIENLFIIEHRYGTFNDMFQFPYVSGPRVVI